MKKYYFSISSKEVFSTPHDETKMYIAYFGNPITIIRHNAKKLVRLEWRTINGSHEIPLEIMKKWMQF